MSVILSQPSNQYLKTTTVPVSTKPVTIAGWYKSTSDALSQTPACISNAANNEFLLCQLRGSVAGDFVAVQEYATAWKWSPTIGYTVDTWQHFAVTFVSATERSVWVNGINKITNTESQDVDFDLFDQILIGTHKTAGGTPFAGRLGHIAIWSKELSDAEILSLANGAVPNTIQESSCEVYWPLKSDGTDKVGSNDLTGFNVPTYATTDNPPVLNFPETNLKTFRRLVLVGSNKIYYEAI